MNESVHTIVMNETLIDPETGQGFHIKLHNIPSHLELDPSPEPDAGDWVSAMAIIAASALVGTLVYNGARKGVLKLRKLRKK